MSGPYGGTWSGITPGVFPVPVSLDVVLGDDPNPTIDFLSLPTGSYVTVGFTDGTVFDGLGDGFIIKEAGPAGERADVFVSANLMDFIYFFYC